MNNSHLWYILIPVSLIIIILCGYLYMNWRKKWLINYFEKQKNENSSTTNQIYNNELRSLNLIKNNDNKEKITDDAATMVYEIDKLKKANFDFSLKGQEQTKKFKILSSNKLLMKIKKNEKSIKELSHKFFETVTFVLGDIKVIRKEITLYKNGLRGLKTQIKKDFDDLKYPKSKVIVESEFETIEDKLKILDDFVASNEMEKAITEFSDIKKSFYSFLIFLNNCKELEKMIFTSLPKYFLRLEQLFNDAKKNTKSDYSYLSFDQQLEDLKIDYQKLINDFNFKNWEKSKKQCGDILTILSRLNNEINSEIESFTFILKNKANLYIYKKNISKLYLSLGEEYRVAYEIDKVYFHQFKEEMSKSLNYLTEIDLWIEKIELDEDDYKISFSSKQFKYKSLYYQLKGFYFLYVELKRKIELFYLEGESNLLKFERLSILFRSINSYVQKNNIILSFTEEENSKRIKQMKQKIVSIIITSPEGVPPHIVNEYQKILSLVIKYVSTVGLKIEISKIFTQIIKLLAPKRSSDIKLNEMIILSENLYLEGDYSRSLNNIIETLNKGTN
ncbi:MAG: hypothetical protein KFW07_02645 [Mycoplasmataceae bacterium]|nr:hypothetical protein [Mycoplasmataceae bacterium]